MRIGYIDESYDKKTRGYAALLLLMLNIEFLIIKWGGLDRPSGDTGRSFHLNFPYSPEITV